MTWREIIFLCLDELKLNSDDSYITEEHIRFIVGKYRAALLKKQYESDPNIPDSNFQTVCVDLEETIDSACEGSYLKSINKIPSMLFPCSAKVFPSVYFKGNFAFISRDRMRYVGHNPWLSNTIYCCLSDGYLYLKSCNPQLMYLEKVKVSGVFEDASEVNTECSDGSGTCDLDSSFPLEDALVPQLVQLVVAELTNTVYKPEDETNNDRDDLGDFMSYIRQNMKRQSLNNNNGEETESEGS